MANHPNRGRKPRPLRLLRQASKDYPDAWSQIDTFRQGKGRDLPDWPDWCFLPMAAWYSIVSADLQVDKIALPLISDVARLAALGAWRYTKGIYQLDGDLMKALADTVPSGALPTDVFYHMPEWSLYIETPGQEWLGDELYGFWAHLEKDMNTGRDELRLLLDTQAKLVPVPIHLGPWTITEAVDRAVSEANRQAGIMGVLSSVPSDAVEQMAESYYPLISILMYVISNGVDWPDLQRPTQAKPKRTKKGWRLFPADKPRFWKLGEKTGEKIRQAKAAQQRGDRAGLEPYIRRSHWHGYWYGPRDGERIFELIWLPPIVVAADDTKRSNTGSSK